MNINISKYCKSTIYALLIALVLTYSGWLYLRTNSNDTYKKTQQTSLFDFKMSNVVATHFNDKGRKTSAVFTPQLIHYPNEDITNYQQPHVIFYEEKTKPWDVRAKYGQSIHGQNIIKLWDDVRIKQSAGPNNQETTIRTESLIVKPKQNYATTSQLITLSRPAITIRSIGMRLYLAEERIELLSQTQGRYGYL